MTGIKELSTKLLNSEASILSLVMFRIMFGLMMLYSAVRFLLYGWLKELYIDVSYHFTFFPFIILPDTNGYIIIYFLLIPLSILICIGYFYRFSISAYFIIFTYIELIDKAYYLNHYYFISLLSFVLIFMPANRYFSFDVRYRDLVPIKKISKFYYLYLQLFLATVYFYAGFAKLNYDWLYEAMPLKLWLNNFADTSYGVEIFRKEWLAYLFSWAGAAYDLSIFIFLWYGRTRLYAYLTVIFFHTMTLFLFNIGIFPLVMIMATSIFFPADWPKKFLKNNDIKTSNKQVHRPGLYRKYILLVVLFFHFMFPLRFLFYKGNVLWNEEGFRFSWRVMLIEKTGHIDYRVESNSGLKKIVDPLKYLTVTQYKMMSTQPDMILDFAHFLKEKFYLDGSAVKVFADSFVSLNSRPHQRFIDPNVDLASVKDSFAQKTWVLKLKK